MSEVMHEAQQEFWRPPTAVVAEPVAAGTMPAPAMAEVCPQCRTEFLVGSRFCHTCGASRPLAATGVTSPDTIEVAGAWQRAVEQSRSVTKLCVEAAKAIELPSWLHYLHFHEIKKWVGLLTAKTFIDWQAIQFYRAEWLLAATAAFVAGILLKRPSKPDRE
jgi:hypothetical protein